MLQILAITRQCQNGRQGPGRVCVTNYAYSESESVKLSILIFELKIIIKPQVVLMDSAPAGFSDVREVANIQHNTICNVELYPRKLGYRSI